MLSELSTYARFTTALPGYLRKRLDPEEAEQLLRDTLANRAANFLRIAELGIYDVPDSPYRKILRWAGVELADLQALVERDGLDAALGTLYDAGVYVTIDEVKGRCAIERPGLHIPASLTAFDNPLLQHHYEARSSGSRGPRTRVKFDLAMLAHETAYVHQYLDAFDLRDRPFAVWRAVPPSGVGVKWQLRLEKLGKPLDRWFSHTRPTLRDGQWPFAVFTYTMLVEGRLLGRRFAAPRHVPGDTPGPVTDWLAAMKATRGPAVLDTMVSSAVRVCADATERGIDISGTLFRLGGEPLTAPKAAAIAAAGGRSVCFYSISELSFVGAPCATPEAPDDVHLLADKLAVLLRPKATSGGSVDALIYTTLLPSSPKLMLNVESGDFARSSIRSCGCPLGALGFTHHLTHIRSYEKLTSEGVTFLGTELLRILEEVLPATFGGGPTDYQFVEAEEAGRSCIYIVASPRLGDLDEREVIERILDTLRAYPGGAMMTELWRQGQTLRVLRREPFRTESAKILPLHLQHLAAS